MRSWAIHPPESYPCCVGCGVVFFGEHSQGWITWRSAGLRLCYRHALWRRGGARVRAAVTSLASSLEPRCGVGALAAARRDHTRAGEAINAIQRANSRRPLRTMPASTNRGVWRGRREWIELSRSNTSGRTSSARTCKPFLWMSWTRCGIWGRDYDRCTKTATAPATRRQPCTIRPASGSCSDTTRKEEECLKRKSSRSKSRSTPGL